jgi:hypothetical protein
VAGLVGKLLEILQLGPAVPFAEGMDVVDVADDDGSLPGKAGRWEPLRKRD